MKDSFDETNLDGADGSMMPGAAGQKPKWRNKNSEKAKKKHKKIKIFGIMVAVLVCLALAGTVGLQEAVKFYMLQGRQAYTLTDELALELSPVDQDKLTAIENGERYDGDDTWAFYFYVVGSNLESGGTSQLSEFTKYTISNQVAAESAASNAYKKAVVREFIDTVYDHGMDLPEAFYVPENPEGESTAPTSANLPACASTDINQILDCELPANVKMVMQTGGAGAWDKPQINPNRSQRFLYSADSDGFEEISNERIANMADPETLAAFLTFCRTNYPADHEVVVLWDHGGASSGYGVDENFGSDILTLDDLQTAFRMSCDASESNPPFEAIFFDCCLMASMEVADHMQGYAKYMIASEEVSYSFSGVEEMEEPVKKWIEAFCADTTQNGAALGKIVTDAYVHYLMDCCESQGEPVGSDRVVYDLNAAGKVKEAYDAFAKAVLQDCIAHPDWLAVVSRAANDSIFLAVDAYRIYNTIDLGIFMENMKPYYPEETKKVLDTIDEAVLYRRGTNFMVDASGMSVYFPAHVDNLYGLARLATYTDSICDNQDVEALYYYKTAGCMPADLEEYCLSQGYGQVQTLDFSSLKEVSKLAVETEDTKMSLQLTPKQSGYISDVRLELMQVNEAKETINYYGEDRYMGYSNEDIDRLDSDFDNKWICIDGQPLYLEVISCTDDIILYSSPVEYNWFDKQLLLSYSFETEEIHVLGVRDYQNATGMVDRGIYSLKDGDTLTFQHYQSDLNGGALKKVSGKTITWNGKRVAADTVLPDGTYAERIVIEDLRGDQYFTRPITFQMQKGEASDIGPIASGIYFARIWE